MKPIAIVIPWFGKDLKGGAEQQAWQVATRLASRGYAVEVLTTCCRSFQDNWSVNHLKARVSQEQGLKIRRFRVDKRDRAGFNHVNELMLNLSTSDFKPGVNLVTLEEANIFCSDNINSTQLLSFLKQYATQYHAFVFIPYLYGPILNGLPIVADRAFLQPCLHNEVYAYLPQVAEIFHKAKGLLFNSEGEAQLAIDLFGPGIIPKSIIVGEGVEVEQHSSVTLAQVQDFLFKQERYVLYLGRRDATKNVDFLVKAFQAFKQQYPDSQLKLVLAGSGNVSFNNSVSGLADLGLVRDDEKELLLANCLALFQPSTNESFSRVMMEAWFHGRPVAVHRNCLATAMAVESAQGGWLAETEIEWVSLFAEIDRVSEDKLAKYGANGQIYAQENAVWDKVLDRYEAIFQLPQTSVDTTQPRARKLKEIHQLSPNIAYGDAISNYAIAVRNYLRDRGYQSNIYVRYMDARVASEASVFQPKCISPQAGLIYHHSIGTELTEYAIAHQGSKCLIYHNITPAKFFLPYRPEVAKQVEKGRLELKQLASHFQLSVGVSAYNTEELVEAGFSNPGVLPLLVEPNKWDMPADPELMRQLQDGRSNLLFVGRLAPNKRQDHLIEAFAHYLTMDREARLILIGGFEFNDPYYCHLVNTIKKFNLSDYVLITGQVDDAQLLAFYRTAHLFWSMSEHEGFCVPIVEAMWFDLPVLAYKSSAIPETLGAAGLMFNTKDNLLQVAALAKLLVKEKQLRAKVIKEQRQRRNQFLKDEIHERLNNLILMMEKVSK